MFNLLFLLGEKRSFYEGEKLLINVIDRLSLYKTAYEIVYCYEETPPGRKIDREPLILTRRKQLIETFQDEDIVIVAMGWMPIELLIGVGRNRKSGVVGCRFPAPPFKYDVWMSHDPAAAIFKPDLYVDIMATVSAAIRYAGRQVIINTNVHPYIWPNI